MTPDTTILTIWSSVIPKKKPASEANPGSAYRRSKAADQRLVNYWSAPWSRPVRQESAVRNMDDRNYLPRSLVGVRFGANSGSIDLNKFGTDRIWITIERISFLELGVDGFKRIIGVDPRVL